jgi:hypothetical protein
MSFEFHVFHTPSESYSRHLDNIVSAQEMPYGYHNDPPPYDHQNREAVEAFDIQKNQFRKGKR